MKSTAPAAAVDAAAVAAEDTLAGAIGVVLAACLICAGLMAWHGAILAIFVAEIGICNLQISILYVLHACLRNRNEEMRNECGSSSTEQQPQAPSIARILHPAPQKKQKSHESYVRRR